MKENGLHLVYVAVESLKVIVLVLVGFQMGCGVPLKNTSKAIE